MNDSVWSHLSGARWFGGKGRGGELRSLVLQNWIVEPGLSEGRLTTLGIAPEIATISYPQGDVEHYLLLSSFSPEPDPRSLVGVSEHGFGGYRHDATRDPAAMQIVLSSLLEKRATESWRPTLTEACNLDATLPARVFTGQQSNTNVMFGDRAILKVFRKLEPGRNVDVVLHEALGRAGVSSVATLFGWVEGTIPTSAGSVGTDLAMLVELLMSTTPWRPAFPRPARPVTTWPKPWDAAWTRRWTRLPSSPTPHLRSAPCSIPSVDEHSPPNVCTGISTSGRPCTLPRAGRSSTSRVSP